MAYLLNFWDYYLTWLSLWIHFCVMYFGVSHWCGDSKIAMCYTAQFVVLHGYCWAIPDRRYTHWVRSNRKVYYMLVIFNITGYVLGIFGGLYMYKRSQEGLFQIMGLSLAVF